MENQLHWHRDVTLREDASQVRSRQVRALLALLNSTVLAFMDVLHVFTVVAQRRRLAAFPAEALRLFLEDL
jgi:hypothetical protein